MRFFCLTLLLLTLPAQAVTWTYVTSDGKNNLRQRIDQKVRNFRLNNIPCKIDEIVKRGDTDETRAVICELTDEMKVTTIAACTSVADKVTNVNVGDLSFIQGAKVYSVILICE
jgi:hypothetical protein